MRYVTVAAMFISLVAGFISLPAAGLPESIKVGILLPLTGHLKVAGETNLHGHQLAVEEINSSGGIKALGGVRLELLVADSHGDPTTGSREAERLVNEGAVALIGAYQSVVTFPATEVAEKHKVPFIISTALANILTERGFKYTFRTEPSQSQFVKAQFGFLEENAYDSQSTLAIIYERTLWGQSTAQVQRAMAKQKGYRVVADIAYPNRLSNYSKI